MEQFVLVVVHNLIFYVFKEGTQETVAEIDV